MENFKLAVLTLGAIGLLIIGFSFLIDGLMYWKCHREGTPLSKEVYANILKAKDETIKSQTKAIAAAERARDTERERYLELWATEKNLREFIDKLYEIVGEEPEE